MMNLQGKSALMNQDCFHVVYIDDDELMLSAARRLIRRLRPRWTLTCIQEASDWQAQIEQAPDLIICDLMMPKIKGTQLLQRAAEQFPLSVRALITGGVNFDVNIIVDKSIHFVIPKPFTDDDFNDVFIRTERLHQFPFSPDVKETLLGLNNIPVLPECIQKLRKAAKQEFLHAKQIVKIIEEEPGLSAKIVNTANSSFLGFMTPTRSLENAVNRLGLNVVESIASIMLTENQFKTLSPHQYQTITSDHLHWAETARFLAKRFSLTLEQQESIYLVALLSSLGDLILLDNQKQLPDLLISENFSNQAIINSYLFLLWGLEMELCDVTLMLDAVEDEVELEDKSVCFVLWLARDWKRANQQGCAEQFAEQFEPEVVEKLAELSLSFKE
ncbi:MULTISPECIES: HDOD domain-containing protein [unclassified Vibrio]|uniref:HDOD domain-containing protein n=1 Tax=Vibrio sp. HB236076 TaxID=3232307 RepID=A0AB39HJY0_9VIBR|nr:HDOD domain-containing protein [Vibrio sp. HB161653]MDP5252692.1 HDOD domain-containing protein [Vibrio sp. HB161653]